MATAIITGASMGFGKALAASLARDGWNLVIDARHEDELRTTATELEAAGATVTAIAGDVAEHSHRVRLVEAAAELGRDRGLDLLVNNASTLGPTPLLELPAYPLAELEQVYRVNVIAPLALRAARAAAAAHRRRHGGVDHLRCGGRAATRRGAGTARRRRRSNSSPTSSAPSNRSCTSTASIRATCAPRCTRTPSPARTSPTARRPETVVPALRRLLHDLPPSGRYRAAALRRAVAVPARRRTRLRFDLPPRARGDVAAGEPRADPRRRADDGRLQARRAPGAQHVRTPADVPRPGRPRRGQHVGHDPRRGRGGRQRRHAGRGAPLDPARRRALGGRASPADWADDRAVERTDPVAPPHAGAGRVDRPRRAVPRQRAAVDRDARSAATGAALARRARPPDPLRLRRSAVAADRLPERLQRRAGQRRDAERRPSVHRRGDHAPRRQGRGRGADRAAHRRGVAGGDRTAVSGADAGARADRRPRQPGARWRPPRDRHRHDRRAGARDGDRAVRRRAARTTAGPISSSRPSEACTRWTGCSPAGTNRRRRTSSCWRRSPTAPCSSGHTPRAWPRATSGTSSATCTSSSDPAPAGRICCTAPAARALRRARGALSTRAARDAVAGRRRSHNRSADAMRDRKCGDRPGARAGRRAGEVARRPAGPGSGQGQAAERSSGWGRLRALG